MPTEDLEDLNLIKKKLTNIHKLQSVHFDFIVLSPGIDIKKCKISSYLIKNRSKIISELDIFEISYPKIDNHLIFLNYI